MIWRTPGVSAASVLACALLGASVFPTPARAGVFEFLGLRQTGGTPVLRLLHLGADRAERYRHLELIDLPLHPPAAPSRRVLVSVPAARSRQRRGAFEAHRRALRSARRSARDQAALEGFARPEELLCFTGDGGVQQASPGRAVGAGPPLKVSRCALAGSAGGGGEEVEIAVGAQVTGVRVLHRGPRSTATVRVPHRRMNLPHGGSALLPVSGVSRAFRLMARGERREGRARHLLGYLLVLRRTRPALPEAQVREVVVVLTPAPGEGRVLLGK